jgi:hypothetical protein
MGRPRFQPGIEYKKQVLGFPTIYFNQHALERMRERGITLDEVFRAIENPDITGLKTQPGRIRSLWKKSNDVAIEVVYEVQVSRVRVVTTWKSDPRRKGGSPPQISRPKSKGKSKERRKRP